ncbi:MAG: TIGR04013 family B12-binding domain/radical SAM domain-containing protein [Mucispirillum sp.]|uniref:TIGR04013 family B12-binding domain/radical SAM domain-containing protein n=1 Tax=Candidatus Mucispirillum faecigallinarum TaxID=2838699 RepID=A0A9D2GVH1_9BACT|nr:TIGR04013 family B12-binding domain/radical SAM domain-containing protein [Mucispirillum sp.]HIZ89485.1 TIGR04013 family B12-binding domain/radical SAM domain-containing protein [Candidatus Mucispirillum faecigallinarum]
MKRAVFVRDKTNKHSIRALLAAYEKWFPEKEYYVLTPKDAFDFLEEDDLALFSFLTGSSTAYIDYVTKLKERLPKLNTICGGAHASARSEDMLKYFDAVCTGEGEESIKDIIEMAEQGRVEGIITGKKVLNLDDYRVFPRKMVSLGPIEIVRGCPSGCAYCQTPQLFRGRLRHRSIDFIVDEIKFALSRKGFADVRFIAPDASSYQFNKGINLEAIESLLYNVRNTIGTNGKLFYGTFPSELDPAGVSKELVDILVKYCDNKQIVLGLQSASHDMQKIMHRRSGLLETENAIELFLDKNFEIVVDLIFGLPYETEETYEETYKFIEKWKGKVTIHSHPFDPLPGSKWQYETPTEVPEKLVKAVRSLEGIGRVFGRVVKDKEKVCRI